MRFRIDDTLIDEISKEKKHSTDSQLIILFEFPQLDPFQRSSLHHWAPDRIIHHDETRDLLSGARHNDLWQIQRIICRSRYVNYGVLSGKHSNIE